MQWIKNLFRFIFEFSYNWPLAFGRVTRNTLNKNDSWSFKPIVQIFYKPTTKMDYLLYICLYLSIFLMSFSIAELVQYLNR